MQDLNLTYQAANEIFNRTVQVIGDMVGQYAELNRAQTEFKKVSDLSGTGLDKYTQKLGQMGKLTARTTSEMVDAATQFRKNSFNDEDSAQLAQVATMYQNVADTSISAADSASFIISQMKAFNFTADKSYKIIDSVNAV